MQAGTTNTPGAAEHALGRGHASYEHKLDQKFAEAERLAALSTAQRDLYRRLATLRLRLARDARIPAYQVLGNQGLLRLCEAQPADAAALLSISGIGQLRSRAYGAEFLAVINTAREPPP